MKTGLYKHLSFLLITTICMALQCRKEDFNSYNFTENINLYPEQKVYHLGDTIWLEHFNALNTLYDYKSNQYFSVDTLSVQFSFSARTYLVTDSTASFHVISNGINVGRNFNGRFGCNGVNFKFKIGIVPKKTGIFSINVNSLHDVYPCSGVVSINGVGFPPSYISYKLTIHDANKDLWLELTPARRTYDREVVNGLIDNAQIFFFKVE